MGSVILGTVLTTTPTLTGVPTTMMERGTRSILLSLARALALAVALAGIPARGRPRIRS